MANAKIDQNREKSLLGVSNADQVSLVDIWADPATHSLLVNASSAPVTAPTAVRQSDGTLYLDIQDLRLDDTSTANVTYVGYAAIGTATSAASWKIKKLDETTGLVITFAGSGAYTQIWDNRTSLSYS